MGLSSLLAQYKISKTRAELDDTHLNMRMTGRWRQYWRPAVLEDQRGIRFMGGRTI